MKKLLTISILAAMVTAGSVLKAQDRPPEYLGLPGDNLNLYAVMKLFQDSKTLEDFERALNDKNTGINNLDLNGDRKVDYITVTDNVNGDVHNIVLQDALSRNDVQDVAVFTVQRLNNGGVQIQLTGDEALYGKNYIIEPNYADQSNGTPNPAYTGDNTVVNGRNVTIVETTPMFIADWPLIRFIFSPGYIGWHSSWYWGYYPNWWYSWEPYYWDYYYGFHYNWFNNYYGCYRLCGFHRYRDWDNIYFHHERHYSQFVHDRIHSGYYRDTYSHPETRRSGEEAYNRTHPIRDRRSNLSSQGNNEVRGYGNRTSVDRRSGISNSYSGNRYSVNTNTGRSSNSTNRRVSGTREINNAGRMNSGSGSNNRREALMNGQNRSSSGMNNRYAFNQPSSQSSVHGNRTISGYNLRSSSGQRSGQTSVNNHTANRQVMSGSSNRSFQHQNFSAGRSSGQTRSSGSISGRSGGGRSFSSGSHSSSSRNSGGHSSGSRSSGGHSSHSSGGGKSSSGRR